jgi:hypothetical protein
MLGRFLQPDSVLDGLNRYTYCGNNPVVYSDPTGHFITSLFTGGTTLWLDAMLWGAALGSYGGYQVGQAAGASGWELAGYTLAGAVIGGVAGVAGSAVATSGIPMANTLGLMTSSAVNSAGMYGLSGGQTDFTVSFGVGNYNFSRGEFGYLGKEGNSWLDNLGYALGGTANLPDVVSLFGGGTRVDAITEKNDPISHAAVVNSKEGINISVGPGDPPYFDKNQGIVDKVEGLFKNTRGKIWRNHASDGLGQAYPVINVNKGLLSHFSDEIAAGSNLIGGPLRYQAIGFSCTSYASRALWAAGIVNIGVHPYLWQASLALRQTGILADPYWDY